jgi:hypothetical protein
MQLLDGESVAAGVTAASLPGKGYGVVVSNALPEHALVLRTLGLQIGVSDRSEIDIEKLLRSLESHHDPQALLDRAAALAPRPVTDADRAAFVAEHQPSFADVDEYLSYLESVLEDFPTSPLTGPSKLLDVLIKLNRNVFRGGFFPAAALFNHACVPNCKFTIDGDVLTVYTLTPVPFRIPSAPSLPACRATCPRHRSVAQYGVVQVVQGAELTVDYLGADRRSHLTCATMRIRIVRTTPCQRGGWLVRTRSDVCVCLWGAVVAYRSDVSLSASSGRSRHALVFPDQS